MSIEYRAIVKGEGETYQKGDQCRLEGITEWDLDMHLSWHEGDSYDAEFAFSYCELRRPIANDQPHYSSPLAEVVAKLAGMEATTSNNEFESKQDKPQEWDGEVLNAKFGDSASWEKYKMLYKGEFCLVYKSESHIECAGRVDSCKFRPIKTEPTEAEKEAEDRDIQIFRMSEIVYNPMVEAVTIKGDNRWIMLAKLYDAGYRLEDSGNE